jgi:hypothetical protein
MSSKSSLPLGFSVSALFGACTDTNLLRLELPHRPSQGGLSSSAHFPCHFRASLSPVCSVKLMTARTWPPITSRPVRVRLIVDVRDVVVVEIALSNEGLQWRPHVFHIEVVVDPFPNMLQKPLSHTSIRATDISDWASTSVSQTVDAGPVSPSMLPDGSLREGEPSGHDGRPHLSLYMRVLRGDRRKFHHTPRHTFLNRPAILILRSTIFYGAASRLLKTNG